MCVKIKLFKTKKMQSSQPGTVFFLTNFVAFSTKKLGKKFLVLIQTNFANGSEKIGKKNPGMESVVFFLFLFSNFVMLPHLLSATGGFSQVWLQVR